ncbi:MAG: nicotinate phosphoribosyltransferase, partial [Longicatena sp.]
EYIIDDLIVQNAQIDSFGVGENLITAKSTPVIGGVYKVVANEKDGEIIPKIKISGNVEKVTNPGFKKVIRFYDNDTNQAIADILALKDEVIDKDQYLLFDPASPWKQKRITNYHYIELQVPIFVNGECVYDAPDTEGVKQYCIEQMDTLWEEVKRLRFPHRYYVDYSKKLFDLKNDLIKQNTVEI